MSETDATVKPDEKKEPVVPPPPPVQVIHEIELNGNSLTYTTTTGMMTLKNAKNEPEANIFFMAYILDDRPDNRQRPLTFVFNGGPGSASVWLHMGALAPYRVKMQDEGWMPAPPYEWVENEDTWLDMTDLVFIDPVGTGYSHAVKPEDNKKYWSVKSDVDSIAEFIRLYLGRYKRWNSPLFLAGESYGTTRSAGLSEKLIDMGIALNGIVLISAVLNFQTLDFVRGNDLTYALYVPTYAATAWYHKRLSAELQAKPLEDVLAEAEAWSTQVYTVALMQGDRLSADDTEKIVEGLMRFTGLSREYILGTKLRVDIWRFCKELLRADHRTVGRLDSRFKGYSDLAIAEFPEFDPSMAAIMPPYTACFNQYVRENLGYESDAVYEILSFAVNRGWEWDRGQFPDTSEALRVALTRNPFMKVLVGQGYYDLATPHFAAHYTFNHMGIDPDLHSNIHYTFYPAGHMYYLDIASLAKFKRDVAQFYTTALG